MDSWKRWNSLVGSVTVAAGLAAALAGAGTARPTRPFTISPIEADFSQARFATYYDVDLLKVGHQPALTKAVREGRVIATWTLELALVDPAGASPPGRPDEAAAVDLGCNNAGVGLPNEPFKQAVDRKDEDTDFTWHHPDGAPTDTYHCDHTMMGPHGHQGLITVVVHYAGWECTATYKGTNSSTRYSVKNGTASEPVCRKVHG